LEKEASDSQGKNKIHNTQPDRGTKHKNDHHTKKYWAITTFIIENIYHSYLKYKLPIQNPKYVDCSIMNMV